MLKKFFGKKSSTKRVLIVEDDALLSRVLSDGFSKEGFKVLMVSNGNDVMAAIDRFSPQMILLDLVIPGLDGFAVLKQIKSQDKIKNIPVAVLSNLGEAADIKSTKALGAVEYFIKSNTEMFRIIDFVKSQLKV
ncbi:MAG: response regulator [Candidatus Buchananbacteria bacterium]